MPRISASSVLVTGAGEVIDRRDEKFMVSEVEPNLTLSERFLLEIEIHSKNQS